MQYTYVTGIKRRQQKVDRLSILNGNKRAVADLVNAVSTYIGESTTDTICLLSDIEVGNLEDFEKFARIVNYQLADLINNMNRELIQERIKLLKSNNIVKIRKIQTQFNTIFCQFLQKDVNLKNIIVKYLRLVISRLAKNSATIKIRIARQLKIIRQALIADDWQQFLKISDKINEIESENYRIFME